MTQEEAQRQGQQKWRAGLETGPTGWLTRVPAAALSCPLDADDRDGVFQGHQRQ